jgi:hypothetical protein
MIIIGFNNAIGDAIIPISLSICFCALVLITFAGTTTAIIKYKEKLREESLKRERDVIDEVNILANPAYETVVTYSTTKTCDNTGTDHTYECVYDLHSGRPNQPYENVQFARIMEPPPTSTGFAKLHTSLPVPIVSLSPDCYFVSFIQ